MDKKQTHWQVNGIPIPPNPNMILPTVIESIPDLPYWSAEALRELYIGTMKMGIEMVKEEKKQRKGKERAQLTRFISAVPNKIKFLPNDRENLLKSFYSTILTSEGLGLLNGFKAANMHGDITRCNPEIQSIRKRSN